MASAGQLVVLAPLIFYLFWITRHRSYLWLLAGFLPITAVNFIGSIKSANSAGLLPYEYLLGIPRILLEQGVIRLLILPFFGRDLTGRFMMWPGYLFWPISVCTIIVFLYCALRYCDLEGEHKRLVIIAYMCMVLTFGMISVSRNYALEYIQRQSGLTLWGMRYSYLPGAVAILIWFAAFFRLRVSGRENLLLRVLPIIVISFWTVQQWNNVYERPNLQWPETAFLLQEALDLRRNDMLQEPHIIRNMRVHPYFYHHAWMSIVFEPDGKIRSIAEKSYRPSR